MWSGWLKDGTSNGILAECESPQTVDQYQDLAQRVFQKLLVLEEGSQAQGWVEIPLPEAGGDVQLYELTDELKGISTTKSCTVINCSPKKLFEFVCTPDLSIRRKFDSELIDMKVLEDVSKDIHVVHRQYRSPAPIIAQRDFVAINAKWTDGRGSYISYGTSVNHRESTNCYESKFVRGNAVVTGLIVRPVPGDKHKSRCTRIIQVDPKGMIPGWAVNATKRRVGLSFLTLRKIIEENVVDVDDDGDDETNVVEESENGDMQAKEAIDLNDLGRVVQPQQFQHGVVVDVENEEDLGQYSSHPSQSIHEEMTEDQQLMQQSFNSYNQHRQPQQQQLLQPHTTTSSEPIHELLLSLQSSVRDVQQQVRAHTQRLHTLDETVTKLNHHVSQMQTTLEQQERTQLQTLFARQQHTPDSTFGWDFVAFALIWPFVTYAIADVIRR